MTKKKTTTSKRWESYADYLESPEWKNIKNDFFSNFEGWDNVCEISGYECEFNEKHLLRLHHFRCPDDWNNDSWTNLILVSKKVHDFIHDLKEEGIEPSPEDISNRERYKTWLLVHWQERLKIGFDSQMWDLNKKYIKLKNYSRLCVTSLDDYRTLVEYLKNDIKELKNAKK